MHVVKCMGVLNTVVVLYICTMYEDTVCMQIHVHTYISMWILYTTWRYYMWSIMYGDIVHIEIVEGTDPLPCWSR